jgi:hypothetical protein
MLSMTRSFLASLAVALAAGAVTARAGAQTTDSTPPRAAFLGKIRGSLDSSGVRGADIRLMFVDSARTVRARNGLDSLEIFVDTLRSRVGVTDSTGNFAIRQLREGRYVMEIRRLGFAPLTGVVAVDSTTLSAVLTMEVVSRLLSTVRVTASSNDRVKERLDRVGFLTRYHSGGSGSFVDRADILRRKPLTVADILSTYGIREQAEFIMDRMPVDYETLRDYPADLVIGVEIYRHNRPTEFNATRRGPTLLSSGGMANLMAPQVLIWTYIP